MGRSCVDCFHCKVKGGVLAFCAKGQWTRSDGSYKWISKEYLPNSRLATTATYCNDYEEDN
jgi:hypothetical protein